jgi:hypothetical protein
MYLKTMKYFFYIISALLIGCSPYASQYAALDAAYAKGAKSTARFYSEHGA